MVAHEACRFFHDITYGCEILIRCDHKNVTNAEIKHTSLCSLRQHLSRDQDYDAKFEYFAGNLNTDAHRLSLLKMLDNLPNDALLEIYAIDELDRNKNTAFCYQWHY